MKKIELGVQHRNLDIKSGNINEEERTVEVSFSSEEPVERYFGTEILDHKESSVDLTRLNAGAAVLEDHQGSQIGKVIGAKIENGRGMAKLMFSKVGRGAEVFQDIIDGIRENISFGYQIMGLTREEDFDEPTYRSFDWMPFEISVVGTPADTTIGIGRSKDTVNELEVEDNFRNINEKRGSSLGAVIDSAVEDMVTDTTTKGDILEQVGSAAGISGNTVGKIIAGDINCPPIERLEGFASVLGVTLQSLLTAAGSDGCEYNPEERKKEINEVDTLNLQKKKLTLLKQRYNALK